MQIKTFQGGFDKNFSYLIWCEKTKIASIIDPAVQIHPMVETINQYNLILDKILITHTHHDHIAYIHDFIDLYPNISNYCYNSPVNADFNYTGLSHNQVTAIGNDILIAIHTPGHFIDSMCFWNKKDNFIFTGDTMFVGRTGRTVSNLSNIKDLYQSTYKKLLTLSKLFSSISIYPYLASMLYLLNQYSNIFGDKLVLTFLPTTYAFFLLIVLF